MLKDNSAKMPIVDAAHGATWATAEDGEGRSRKTSTAW